jgi:hypothetical protein
MPGDTSRARPTDTSGMRAEPFRPRAASPAEARRETPWVASVAMGAFAGAASKTVVAPFERVRMLMQMSAPTSGEVTARANFSAVLKREGPMGLWRGNGLAVVRATLQKGYLFATQDSLRASTGSDMIAGGIAGLTASGLTYPLDLLRTRHAGRVGTGSLVAVATEAVRAHGLLSLWGGASATLAGGMVFEAMRFGFFGRLRDVTDRQGEPVMGPAACGALASTVAGNIIYPNDTIRRRLQTVEGRHETYAQAARKLFAEGGFKRVYRGFLLYNLKAVPAAAVQFGTYHELKRLLQSRNSKH